MARISATQLVTVVLGTALAMGTLVGCQSGTGTTLPSGSPSGTALPDVGTDEVQGATEIGPLGDPCALLTSDEIQMATSVAVLGIVRGEIKADGSQLCAWAMDAQGSTNAALGAYTGSLGPGGLGQVVDGMGGAGAVVGVIVAPVDPDLNSGDTSDDGSQPPPEIQIAKLPFGVAVATPNGGAAFGSNGTTQITLMKLIAGPATTTEMTDLITLAYNRLP